MKRSSEIQAVGVATVGTGAAVTAAIASACCVGPALAPIFLAIFGASGLVAVSGLRPYTFWMLLGSAAMLAFSFRQLYRKNACSTPTAMSTVSRGVRFARAILWIAALLWFVSSSYALYGFFHE